MGVTNFEELKRHIGHKIVCVSYGGEKFEREPWNISIECEDCGEVLLDFDRSVCALCGKVMEKHEWEWGDGEECHMECCIKECSKECRQCERYLPLESTECDDCGGTLTDLTSKRKKELVKMFKEREKG